MKIQCPKCGKLKRWKSFFYREDICLICWKKKQTKMPGYILIKDGTFK